MVTATPSPRYSPADELAELDWSFTHAPSTELTHSFHPYPAKFIPQIPRAIVDRLTCEGDRVLDPFCGSGTAVVEAIRAGRAATGVDLNPLAALITKVKATPLPDSLLAQVPAFLADVEDEIGAIYGRPSLLGRTDPLELWMPEFRRRSHWFDERVLRELAVTHALIEETVNPDLRDFLTVGFSSIVVAVSNQDSDTRYVRREKTLPPMVVPTRLRRKLTDMCDRMRSFAAEVPASARPTVHVADARDLSFLPAGTFSLVVTSPPYPNAYSYHLYHRFRMLWLGIDDEAFKAEEIGSHRKYSRANGASAETFAEEMSRCIIGLRRALKPGGFCVFVIGDSVIRGQLLENNRLIARVADEAGFRLIADVAREIASERKAFNPAIGKIRHEHIVVLEN